MPAYEELRAQAEQAKQPTPGPQRPLIKVGVTTCSRAVGAQETLDAVRKELADRGLEADVMVTGCWGLCYAEPIVEVAHPGRPSVLYGSLTADKVPQLIEGALGPDQGGVVPELALAVVGDEPLEGVAPLRSMEFFAGQERRLMANCGVT
ncbi:MAG: (2Fe-2S) ferredoxin domain-containing protein, partial [Dehalococcoidia bacterium]